MQLECMYVTTDPNQEGTYCVVSNVAHSKSQRKVCQCVIVYKPKPEKRCHSKHKSNHDTVTVKELVKFNHNNTKVITGRDDDTYDPSEPSARYSSTETKPELFPRTIR